MTVTRLVLREIRHRKLNFLLALLSVSIATACLVGSQTVLRGDQIVTERLLADKRAEVEAAVAESEEAVAAAGTDLEDAIRKQMLKLGFNILIVPESQELSELHLNGTLTETMPESYVDKLANSPIITINHLLPSVTKRLEIERDGTTIDAIVQGTRGEVPIQHRGLKKMLLDAVPPDTIVVGYQIHQKFGLKIDDTIELLGKEFKVTKLHPERGSTDDVTVWIDLAQAQELFEMQNVVNAILALECECAGDRITVIREEIAGILPGTKVVERFSQAITRAEARAKAKETAESALAQQKQDGAELLAAEEQTRADIEDRHAGLVAVLVPIVFVGCAIWIGLLGVANVRQRTSEIGILRAIGLGSNQILSLFLSRAIVTGLIGGVIGCGLGLLVGSALGAGDVSWDELFAATSLVGTVCMTPFLAPVFSAIASWLPAMMASRQDPALVLQGD